MPRFRPTSHAVLVLLLCGCLMPNGLSGFPQAAWAQANSVVTSTTSQPQFKVAPVLSERAKVVLERLLAANPLKNNPVKTIEVIEDSDWNAYTDGQTIYVTHSLWNALNTEDQRAFVISHELSHILLGHVPKTTARRMAISALAQFVLNKYTQNKQLLQQLENVTLNAIDMKFSRNMELGADERGVQLMTTAQYNSMGAIEAFEIMEQHSKNGPPEFLRSHPISKTRIQALSKRYGLQSPTKK